MVRPASATPAVVLSHGPGGLGATRSLGRLGVPVTVVIYDDHDPARYTRLSFNMLSVQGEDHAERESNLLELLRSLDMDGAAILTTSDRLVSFVSVHRDELSRKYRFNLPPTEMLDGLNDKSREVRLIESLGFEIPRTVTALPAEPRLLDAELRYPLIIKPHSFNAENVFPHKNAIIPDRRQLEEFYEVWEAALPSVLAQEVIPGPDTYSWVGSGTFDTNHELLDYGIKQKLRCLPAHFGGSTCARSRDNSEILRLSRELGKALRYVGHAGVEFRWDDRDRSFKYIEINPRMPANVGFDEACGLKTVWNSYRIALDEEPDRLPRAQRNGVYFLDLRGDSYSMREDGLSPARIIGDYLSLLFKKTNGMYFAWDDPVPGFYVGWRFVMQKLRGLNRRLRRRVTAALIMS
jgi:predicted ATP-grasp superfamily ATP-dependent carboligase